MGNNVLTIKMSVFIALLAGTAIVSSFATYSFVHATEAVNCTTLIQKEEVKEQTGNQFFKRHNLNTTDGRRF